ncbi:MAG TPA: EthD family reductase [Dehalococcoidia bacterium]|nr:EthD family reductase [Dehalococcoidia bacterium]
MIKVIGIFKKPATMNVEEFRAWMLETHAPLARKLPGQSKYVVSLTIGAPEQVPRYDCVGEIWFEDQSTLQKALESREMAEGLRDTQSHNVDVAIVFTEEHVIP